nr:unnamed protein product [Callosobruchus analis]CAI5826486.1 unnamed protein product [Callosobruchus analis]CAI5861510.1 unnamed protein product [Callosobruchus analis]
MVITREIREEIKNSVTYTINSILKEEGFIDKLVQKVSDNLAKTISEKIDQLRRDFDKVCQENSTVIRELKEETNMLKMENEYLTQKFDTYEQEARSCNLRLFKVKENPQENLKGVIIHLFETHLNIKLNLDDIVFCTRFGKKQDGHSRGILLKLAKVGMKQNIYSKKKMFKGSGVIVKEDLTDARLKLMEAAIEKTSLRSVWSHHGTIMAMKGNHRVTIKTKEDLCKL